LRDGAKEFIGPQRIDTSELTHVGLLIGLIRMDWMILDAPVCSYAIALNFFQPWRVLKIDNPPLCFYRHLRSL
jgi:hypothetical protein